MASSKRDDFSKTTIEKVAKRVAYRCSCPTCNQITIGPSYESDSSITNVGVAAHIYAASPGGPRYNPKMTATERKSISNCLWLCQTHATMIDRDIVTYTPEKLISWKKDAETSAFYELAKGNTNFLENYMLTYDGDMQILSDIVDKCIYNGEYDILKNILSSY